NAANNKIQDPAMIKIKVTINPEQNLISVYKNGSGIPVEIHKEEKVYIPELIFGHLLTSSNYDDSEKKVVSELNVYGAKLNGKQRVGQEVSQKFTNNMSVIGPPKITKLGKGE
ncbi:DNA topoisomerase 2, partial [Massospora cicadina]